MPPISLAWFLNAMCFDCEMTRWKAHISFSSWIFKACFFFLTQLSAVSRGSSHCTQKLSNFRRLNSARFAEVLMEGRSEHVSLWLQMTVQIEHAHGWSFSPPDTSLCQGYSFVILDDHSPNIRDFGRGSCFSDCSWAMESGTSTV